MKVLISADMEGTAGVAHSVHVTPPDRAAESGVHNNSAEVDWARRLMIEEVNAAVTGVREEGATEVWVTEGHGFMRNLLPLALHPEAHYVSGQPSSWVRSKASMACLGQFFVEDITDGPALRRRYWRIRLLA